jgi:hypothetical protein
MKLSQSEPRPAVARRRVPAGGGAVKATSKVHRQRGAPRKQHMLLEIVGQLNGEGAFAGLTRKQQSALVAGRATRDHPDAYPPGPSHQRIVEALQELGIAKRNPARP